MRINAHVSGGTLGANRSHHKMHAKRKWPRRNCYCCLHGQVQVSVWPISLNFIFLVSHLMRQNWKWFWIQLTINWEISSKGLDTLPLYTPIHCTLLPISRSRTEIQKIGQFYGNKTVEVHSLTYTILDLTSRHQLDRRVLAIYIE